VAQDAGDGAGLTGTGWLPDRAGWRAQSWRSASAARRSARPSATVSPDGGEWSRSTGIRSTGEREGLSGTPARARALVHAVDGSIAPPSDIDYLADTDSIYGWLTARTAKADPSSAGRTSSPRRRRPTAAGSVRLAAVKRCSSWGDVVEVGPPSQVSCHGVRNGGPSNPSKQASACSDDASRQHFHLAPSLVKRLLRCSDPRLFHAFSCRAGSRPRQPKSLQRAVIPRSCMKHLVLLTPHSLAIPRKL
jgi:hypothetical protein